MSFGIEEFRKRTYYTPDPCRFAVGEEVFYRFRLISRVVRESRVKEIRFMRFEPIMGYKLLMKDGKSVSERNVFKTREEALAAIEKTQAMLKKSREMKK